MYCMYAWMYVCVSACLAVCKHACMHVCMYVGVLLISINARVCAYICIHMYRYVTYISIYIHINIHRHTDMGYVFPLPNKMCVLLSIYIYRVLSRKWLWMYHLDSEGFCFHWQSIHGSAPAKRSSSRTITSRYLK